MAGAGLADIQAEVWDLYHAGKQAQARDLFLRFLPAAVLERRTGFVLQKEILRRRGILRPSSCGIRASSAWMPPTLLSSIASLRHCVRITASECVIRRYYGHQ